MNELKEEGSLEIDQVRSFLSCLIKSDLNWELSIQASIETSMDHHSLLSGYEFLFNFKNQFALLKNCEIKNWFIREDYQFQLMKFSRSYSQEIARDRKIIHIVRLQVEAAIAEIIVVTPVIEFGSSYQSQIAS